MYTVGVFIDMKKAFDTIDHKLLIQKLQHFGIRREPNMWLSSYLSDRSQFVNLDEINSNIYKVVCGVPQGSILGPKLFILYINDLCKVSNIVKFILFADDTNIYSSGFDLKENCVNINKELEKLNEACGTKSGQILLNCVTDAIIVNIYIKYRLKLVENELGHTFELNVTF